LYPHKIFDFRYFPFEGRAGHHTGDPVSATLLPGGVINCIGNPIDLGGIFVKPVITHFVLIVKDDQHATGQSNAQSGNIDEAVNPVPAQVPKGNLEIIIKHIH